MCNWSKISSTRKVNFPTIQEAFSWSCKGDLPLNAGKSQYLSIRGPPHHFLVLFEGTWSNQMNKCEKINDLGIAVNSTFTPSANVLTAANKARGMLHFNKRSITCLTDLMYLYIAHWWDHRMHSAQINFPVTRRLCLLGTFCCGVLFRPSSESPMRLWWSDTRSPNVFNVFPFSTCLSAHP